MTIKDLMNTMLNKKKGSFIKIKYANELPTTSKTKKSGISVTKETITTIRTRIKYANMKSVKALEKELTHELPYGSFVSGSDGLLIQNKDKTYLRAYSSPNKSKSKYFVNGVEISFDELKNSGYVVNSWFNKQEDKPAAFNININNILEIY